MSRLVNLDRDDHPNAAKSLVDWAALYADAGFLVFPCYALGPDGRCTCGKSDCRGPGKHPATVHGLRDASRDKGQLEAWFADSQRNLAIATGRASGVFVLDVDGPVGATAVAEWEAQYGPLPPTLRVRTGSGGTHYYFCYPTDGTIIGNRTHIEPQLGIQSAMGGIDIRGEGGYVIAPPSNHYSGGQYEWLDEGDTLLAPEREAIATAPPWLLDKINPPPMVRSAPPSAAGLTTAADVRQRASVYLAKMAPAISGQGGHNATFEAARVVVYGFDLGIEAGLELLLAEYNPRCAPPWSEAELRHKCQDADTKPFDQPRGHLRDAVRSGEKRVGRERMSHPPRETVAAVVAHSSLPTPPSALPTSPHWPDPPAAMAYTGLVGDWVRVVGLHTESASVGLLLQSLVMFGNALGRTAHRIADGTPHHTNEFVVLVGATGSGRKGTSGNVVTNWFDAAARDWSQHCRHGGVSSGEGLMWAIHDPIENRGAVVDAGVADKRLLVYEPEFANVLKQGERSGNTVSVILRQMWDGLPFIKSMTKTNPTAVTGGHVSLIGHITPTELQRLLTATEMANGFGNRILWALVRRANVLPDGGRAPDEQVNPLVGQLCERIQFGRSVGELDRSDCGRAVWHALYPELTRERHGLAEELLSRAAPHVLRLAMLYALLAGRKQIIGDDFRAAVAVWDYCERSVRHLFGSASGDPIADEVWNTIQAAMAKGVTRTELSNFFGRNLSAAKLGTTLQSLLANGRVRSEREETGGRPAERFFAVATATPPGSPLLRLAGLA
jgi:hypothetical protein